MFEADKFQEVLAVIAKHCGNKFPIQAAEHDVIYFVLGEEHVSAESEEGRLLESLGCCLDEGWLMYV